jgi:hypothetical protein
LIESPTWDYCLRCQDKKFNSRLNWRNLPRSNMLKILMIFKCQIPIVQLNM